MIERIEMQTDLANEMLKDEIDRFRDALRVEIDERLELLRREYVIKSPKHVALVSGISS